VAAHLEVDEQRFFDAWGPFPAGALREHRFPLPRSRCGRLPPNAPTSNERVEAFDRRRTTVSGALNRFPCATTRRKTMPKASKVHDEGSGAPENETIGGLD